MADPLLAALCATSIALNASGTVVVVAKVEPPLSQRVMKAQLPNHGQMFEPPRLEHWSITIKFPNALLLLEEDGPRRWHEGQVVSLDGDLCGTPFRLYPE
jgi:hypothetical protein